MKESAHLGVSTLTLSFHSTTSPTFSNRVETTTRLSHSIKKHSTGVAMCWVCGTSARSPLLITSRVCSEHEETTTRPNRFTEKHSTGVAMC